MRRTGKRGIGRGCGRISLLGVVLLIILTNPLTARRVRISFHPEPTDGAIETNLGSVALGTDTVFCDGRPLPHEDYSLDPATGRLILHQMVSCSTITVSVFKVPDWLAAPAGNPVPEGRTMLNAGPEPVTAPTRPPMMPQKVTLSGNKSFSMTVGRSGEGRFSQGLALDFDATIATDLRIHGSVADRGTGSSGGLTSAGGTAMLSELDKYFFEIEGKRLSARGGDIATHPSLPSKRIKGVYASFRGNNLEVASGIGRPAGKFVLQTLSGVDGRQGPYQLLGNNGLPTGVVPGSEKVYLDGRLLEGGSDKQYRIDYPAGRITFSPRVLITSRSRIEVDFEAAENAYEQAVYDVAGAVRVAGRKAAVEIGARRETDEKDRLRFGALSSSDVELLRRAGDSPENAAKSGAAPTAGGAYTLVTDSVGERYYLFVGSGAGQYQVAFSLVGSGKGDYRYLGDGIYQYAGNGKGDFLPLLFLPLPSRNDFMFSSLELRPYASGILQFRFTGNDRDRNLYSSADDGDNFTSQWEARYTHQHDHAKASAIVRYRQEGFASVTRLDNPDDRRVWALPAGAVSGNELRAETNYELAMADSRLAAGYGYLEYKDRLTSRRLNLTANFFENHSLTPRAAYQSGIGKRGFGLSGDGLFEKLTAGLGVKGIPYVRLDCDFDRELAKNRYEAAPDVQKYEQYRGAAFFRSSVVSVSRRIEFTSGALGQKGPQQDRIELASEEQLGRFHLTLAGTYLNQRRLDSDRENRIERLYAASLQYTPGSGWITMQAEYRQNLQAEKASQYRYIRVAGGEGEYRYENGQYLYDPDGDYIRIREETGADVSVSTGEKSHNILLYPGRLPAFARYQKILSQVSGRLRTQVMEERPGGGGRTMAWLLPWASRAGDYLRRTRREGYALLLFPVSNFYVLNLTYTGVFEEQQAGSLLYRDRKEYAAEFKSQLSGQARLRLQWRRRLSGEHGLGVARLHLRITDYLAGLPVVQGRWQYQPEVGYIRIADTVSHGRGYGGWVRSELVYRHAGQGEIRAEAEGSYLKALEPFDQPEFVITDGRRFGRSAMVGLVASYDIGQSLRLTVNVTDRIFEHRPAEFVGRGELVAKF